MKGQRPTSNAERYEGHTPTKWRRSYEFYIERLLPIYLLLTGFLPPEIPGDSMSGLFAAVAFASLLACQALADERSALARVTVYWHGEGSGERAAWNGAPLHEAHCAIDPKRIPYGSKVVFPDATCVAVDSGPAVVNRKAARSSGRTSTERNAIVIDRFFDTKQKALAWAKAHPPFMTVRILTPGTEEGTKVVDLKSPGPSPADIAGSATTSLEPTARELPSTVRQ